MCYVDDENASNYRANLILKNQFKFKPLGKKYQGVSKQLGHKPLVSISPSKRPDGKSGLRISVGNAIASKLSITPGDLVLISIDRESKAMRLEKTEDKEWGRKTTATSKKGNSFAVKFNPYSGIPVPTCLTEVVFAIEDDGLNFLLPENIVFVI